MWLNEPEEWPGVKRPNMLFQHLGGVSNTPLITKSEEQTQDNRKLKTHS